jgi:SAM-dependent methyltransferase
VVIDVGAGTGKLARALLPSGAEVVAVEPVAAMRAVLERSTPSLRALEGAAEALPVADGSADAVVAGQAFHWFDAPAALGDFHRVLRPGGRVALIWNRRRREQAFHRAIDAIIEPYRGDTPSLQSGWRRAIEQTPLFEPVDELTLAFEQVVDQAQLLDRVSSISFIAALDRREREEVLDRLRELAGGQPQRMSYLTEIFIYGRLP